MNIKSSRLVAPSVRQKTAKQAPKAKEASSDNLSFSAQDGKVFHNKPIFEGAVRGFFQGAFAGPDLGSQLRFGATYGGVSGVLDAIELNAGKDNMKQTVQDAAVIGGFGAMIGALEGVATHLIADMLGGSIPAYVVAGAGLNASFLLHDMLVGEN